MRFADATGYPGLFISTSPPAPTVHHLNYRSVPSTRPRPRGKPFNMLSNLKLLTKTLKRLCGPVLSVLVLLAFGARIPFIVGLPCTLKDVHDTSSVYIPYPAMTVSECLQSSQGSGLSLRHLQPHQCGSQSQQAAALTTQGSQAGQGGDCRAL